MKCSSEDGNCSDNIQSQKRQRTSSGTLMDLDVLNCPICVEPLTSPIFQCENGHVICHICCPKLKGNECHVCRVPIGYIRCRAMENVVESVIVPCQNASLGCTKILPYGKKSIHEKEYCKFSLCTCPGCKYTGSYSEIYYHYPSCQLLGPFITFGKPSIVTMNITDKVLVRMSFTKTYLFVVQCFREPNGVYVTVSCVSPLAPEVEKFSYRISYSFNGRTCTHKSREMKRILEVRFQIPQERNFMFIPNGLLCGEELKMELCISELNKSALDWD